MTGGALAGVRVVDLANFLAGPLVSMYLGDFGAEVVKVERPDGGDELRMWGHAKDGVGLYFKVVNRNKKSVTADLRTPLGVESSGGSSPTRTSSSRTSGPGRSSAGGSGRTCCSSSTRGSCWSASAGSARRGPTALGRGSGRSPRRSPAMRT